MPEIWVKLKRVHSQQRCQNVGEIGTAGAVAAIGNYRCEVLLTSLVWKFITLAVQSTLLVCSTFAEMQRVAWICQWQLILVILRQQGRRSLWDRGDTSHNIWTRGTLLWVSPIIWGVNSSQVTTSVPFNHEVVMVKIRSIFQLTLAVFFMAFCFTKTHILL